MPMYRDWVPKAIRPWIYVIFAFVFQLSGTWYGGAMSQIMGTTCLMREDVTMIIMMGVVGVNMPFPFLFRFKFRFTNHQLLLTAATVILVCDLLSMWVTWVPLLCLLSYVAGFFKLCGTFECISNIRLWISPKQNFGVFLPTIYIIILGAMSASTWITQQVTYHYDNWQMMNWLMAGVFIVMILLLLLLTKNFRFMPPMPLLSLDWLGCVLWSTVMLEVIWLFVYGEFYNWTDGAMWRVVAVALPVTLAVSIARMRRIRHPYIEPQLWRHSRLIPILGMFAVAEMMNATPRVLQTTFTGGVLHWGMLTTSVLNLWEWAGTIIGCLMVIWWSLSVRRSYTGVLSLGFAALLIYQVVMYFSISLSMPLERLYVPTLLRAMGYAIFFATMTLYLKDLINFPAFFMALTMSGFIRNGVVESMFSGIYSYHLRYHIADNMVRGVPYDMVQAVMVSVKQGYGAVCVIGVIILLLMLIYEFQPVRLRVRKMPSIFAIRRLLAMRQRTTSKAV